VDGRICENDVGTQENKSIEKEFVLRGLKRDEKIEEKDQRRVLTAAAITSNINSTKSSALFTNSNVSKISLS